ncbi:uncharacterized protein BX663DRAFT_548226 [Cokeromyces recurvatus]|uniref:uncharacterized protein n=1 Tax=Cokeromyces recurvatus TaxID=90255 RepID=UPI00221E5ACD|nr:uncharacterized protein BX663DRAFT_548226 [Cokeromyces recurvatus]KAI7907149.1 hypothetical protein BX663DRAFT_548226 [Cokeromyces recurvatus]
MALSDKEGETLPLIVFIPIIICVVAIFILLDIRQRQNNSQTHINHIVLNQQADISNQDDEEEEQQQEEEIEDDNHGEGSSTSVARVKKVGKKRGERLKRKEAMRQYREYMDQQRELRRAQEEVYEEEFRRRKVEESIKRADELEKRRKEKERKARADKKEEEKRQKQAEKEKKKSQSRFDKYSGKLKKIVKEKKLCNTDEIAKTLGLSKEDTVSILKQLCKEDVEFELCLWSGTDTFLFITEEDYVQFNQTIKQKGIMSIHEGIIF